MADPVKVVQPPQVPAFAKKAVANFGSRGVGGVSTSKQPNFYKGGNIIWDFQRQPNFVPETFIRIRNQSQAWFYKVTSLAMLVLIGVMFYGAYIGIEFTQLQTEEGKLQKELVLARSKEHEAQARAKSLYDRISAIEKKVAYDAIRQPGSDMIYQLASSLPNDFYIQNLSYTSEDNANDSKGTSIGAFYSGQQSADMIRAYVNTVTLSGRIIGVGADATETKLVAHCKSLPGFRILSSQTMGSRGGADIMFEQKIAVKFDFTPSPSTFLRK